MSLPVFPLDCHRSKSYYNSSFDPHRNVTYPVASERCGTSKLSSCPHLDLRRGNNSPGFRLLQHEKQLELGHRGRLTCDYARDGIPRSQRGLFLGGIELVSERRSRSVTLNVQRLQGRKRSSERTSRQHEVFARRANGSELGNAVGPSPMRDHPGSDTCT